MQKRVLAVHDLSCVGRCSLTVALPILSAAGLHTAVVPTALLSTHTGEFTGYTHMDLSSQLAPITGHLRTLGVHYDAFYSGYLANSAQVDHVLAMIDALCDERTHLFVDPAFGDFGRMYTLMDESIPRQMRRLCARARTIVPNLTEACFLLELPYPQAGADNAFINRVCQGLLAMGPENVVVTDVNLRPGQTGVALLRRGMTRPEHLFQKRYNRLFHGTGDVFASFLLGALMNGQSLERSAQTALDITHLAIVETLRSGEPLRYGVQFEKVLPAYLRKLHQK